MEKSGRMGGISGIEIVRRRINRTINARLASGSLFADESSVQRGYNWCGFDLMFRSRDPRFHYISHSSSFTSSSFVSRNREFSCFSRFLTPIVAFLRGLVAIVKRSIRRKNFYVSKRDCTILQFLTKSIFNRQYYKEAFRPFFEKRHGRTGFV